MWNINKKYQNLGTEFFSFVSPTPLMNNPSLIHINGELVKQLNLQNISAATWQNILSGVEQCAGYQSLSSIYMGHQFGVLVPRLGDGRAILIAEHESIDGVSWELQLKGAGATPYSRRGDGRAVLRSSIREYLVSHAMTKLNIPTTLALGLLVSDDKVVREEIESAAIVLRVAESFLRFGNFEYFAHHNKPQELVKLIKFTIQNYFTHIDINNANYIAQFLQEIVIRTARMVAGWQSVGFVHGVINTDNMSILGLTIDYGPYAFLDLYEPKHIFNHSDSEGRYTYANQPHIAWWNLYRLAEALTILDDVSEELLQPVLDSFAEYYNHEYQTIMWQKLGINDYQRVTDKNLFEDVLKFMQVNKLDWTYFWRKISSERGTQDLLAQYSNVKFDEIMGRIQSEQSLTIKSQDKIYQQMQKVNPAIILRSHLLHMAINKAKTGDYSEVDVLFKLINNPYEEFDGYEYYYQLPPMWASHLSLSCSS
ncbi:MAG: YdiU family protein [Burkholderiales bacterium]|nr:YdiU family protein [Burkholderiales bacterium]